jgi:hypothetical protein
MTRITPTRLPGARAALRRQLDAWSHRFALRWPALAAHAMFAAAIAATALMIVVAPSHLLA